MMRGYMYIATTVAVLMAASHLGFVMGDTTHVVPEDFDYSVCFGDCVGCCEPGPNYYEEYEQCNEELAELTQFCGTAEGMYGDAPNYGYGS